jgi:hypothetical protein
LKYNLGDSKLVQGRDVVYNSLIGTFGQKEHFCYISTELPSEIVLYLIDKMEFFKIDLPILSDAFFGPRGLESWAVIPILGG